jgi:isopentenyl diphosphate isomerase/L-lactate dehydrogenase-like FMN-dependent dehydrogenase
MKAETNPSFERRRLLKYLAASPLLANPLISQALAGDSFQSLAANNGFYKDNLNELISQAEQALSVFDYERVARATLPPAHYGYVATGVDGNQTLRANREAFDDIQLRARRMADFSRFDMSVKLFGESWPSPIALAPVSSQANMHYEGDVATARAAGKTNTLQIHSTFASKSLEAVNKAYGRPVWFQLYAEQNWGQTLQIIRRAENAGCEVVVFTVDMFAGSNRETMKRFATADNRQCSACHTKGHFEKPMTEGMDYKLAKFLTWDYVRRLKDSTKMKLVVKGIVTAEDARLCIANGADGIVVSNHGGRALETNRATIECLPEIVAEVKGAVPVLIDSGFRRGTDVFKALALGADAVCIGRPYLWGLAAFGSDGVEGVIKLLRAELALTMKKVGAVQTGHFGPEFLSY